MYQRLFQITLVLLLVVVSIAMVAVLITAILSAGPLPMLAQEYGIVVTVGGISERRFGLMIVAASLIIAGFYLYFRRRRFRR